MAAPLEHRRPRLTYADARAALWALGAVRTARRRLQAGRLDTVHVVVPGPSEARAHRAVAKILDLRRCSCLERALVYQAWYAARGHGRDVVIGVTGPRGFAAHAWLDGDAQCHDEDFHEIARLPPPIATGAADGDGSA